MEVFILWHTSSYHILNSWEHTIKTHKRNLSCLLSLYLIKLTNEKIFIIFIPIFTKMSHPSKIVKFKTSYVNTHIYT